MDARDKHTMRLIPKALKMSENVELTLFLIERWSLDFKNKTKPRKGIHMTISLKRRIMSEIMTTYLPSILLMMITYATTFFKPVYFEAALTVNLTNMLVMTTIFISVMERLPTTSYIKMIDIWLIFCQVVPFTEVMPLFSFLNMLIIFFFTSWTFNTKVILLTTIESLREKKKKTRKRKQKNKSQTTDDVSSKGSTPRSASLDVSSVETAEAWSDHSDEKSGYQWISGLKMLGMYLWCYGR